VKECWGIGSETHYSITPPLHKKQFFLAELPQKSQVVLEEEPDVVNLIL
jgi:hypothetical protein